MRILLFTHYYDPEVGAPQRRWRQLVESFTRRGHQVAVCAPVPHYPFRTAHGLEVRESRQWSWADGQHGERILRVPYAPTSGSMSGQLIDHTVSSAAMAAISATMRRHRPDVLVSTAPGLPMPFAADAAARWLDVPHVAEVRDAWPDLITDARLVHRVARGRIPGAIASALDARILPGVFHSVLRRAAAIVTTTEAFSERLRSRGMSRVVTIRNTSDVPAIERRSTLRRAGDGLNLLYVGTVGRSQGLDAVVRAVDSLPGVRLHIVGTGAASDALRSVVSSSHERIRFFPHTTGPQLSAHWAWAHTGLVSLADMPAYEVTVPSKLMAIMARGLHVTAVVAGETAQIIRDSNAGHVTPPGDVSALRDLLETLRDDPTSTEVDERPRTWVREHASPEAAADAYMRLLEHVQP